MMFFKCRLITAVLILIVPMFTSAFVTTVKMSDSAALSCPVPQDPSPGVMQWKRNGEIVAECGPAAKAAFRFTCKMDEGNNTLTVPQANSSTTGSYAVYSDDLEIEECRQYLKLMPTEFHLEKKTGDHLILDLHGLKYAIITSTTPGNSSILVVCRVEKGVPQCPPEYQERVFVSGNTLMLLDLKPSDSGNYSVRDRGQRVVSSSYLTVKDVPQKAGYWLAFLHGALSLGVVMLVLGLVLGMFVVPRGVINRIRRAIQKCRERNHSNNNTNVKDENKTPTETVPLRDICCDVGPIPEV